MPVLTVHHSTIYRYGVPVAFGEHSIIARPQGWPDQRLLNSSVVISPQPARFDWSRDPFGNWIGTVAFREKSTELRFNSTVQVEHRTVQAAGRAEVVHRSIPPEYTRNEQAQLRAWRASPGPDKGNPVGEWVRDLARASGSESTLGLLVTINAALRRFRYVRRAEQGTQPAALTLTLQSGSCRDLATLMVEALQQLGFAARFVSGYIRVPLGDRSGLLGGGSTHAWVQVYMPGTGWLDLDPTNNLVGSRDLVRIAVAQRAYQVIPLSGTWYGNASDSLGMTVSVDVTSEDRPSTDWSTYVPRPVGAAEAGGDTVAEERR